MQSEPRDLQRIPSQANSLWLSLFVFRELLGDQSHLQRGFTIRSSSLSHTNLRQASKAVNRGDRQTEDVRPRDSSCPIALDSLMTALTRKSVVVDSWFNFVCALERRCDLSSGVLELKRDPHEPDLVWQRYAESGNQSGIQAPTLTNHTPAFSWRLELRVSKKYILVQHQRLLEAFTATAMRHA